MVHGEELCNLSWLNWFHAKPLDCDCMSTFCTYNMCINVFCQICFSHSLSCCGFVLTVLLYHRIKSNVTTNHTSNLSSCVLCSCDALLRVHLIIWVNKYNILIKEITHKWGSIRCCVLVSELDLMSWWNCLLPLNEKCLSYVVVTSCTRWDKTLMTIKRGDTTLPVLWWRLLTCAWEIITF